MKKSFILVSFALMTLVFHCKAGDPGKESKSDTPDIIIHLTEATFKQKVFNYELNKHWKYEGSKPAIVDFYADWCGPCKKLTPILDELEEYYEDKITVKRIDVDKQRQIANELHIMSIPTLIIYKDATEQVKLHGLRSKESLIKIIDDLLK